MSEQNLQFEEARAHLADLSDEELKQRFWELTDKIVDPLIELGKTNTTPSIERSVLLRMGFSSVEATAIVDQALKQNLIGKGAGHIVYRIAKENDLTIREAGLALGEGEYWKQVNDSFESSVLEEGGN